MKHSREPKQDKNFNKRAEKRTKQKKARQERRAFLERRLDRSIAYDYAKVITKMIGYRFTCWIPDHEMKEIREQMNECK